MTTKTRVKVTVCGTDYNVVSSESIDYVRGVGKEVNNFMNDIMDRNPTVSTTAAAVLTGITFADERKKALASADHLRSQLKEYLNDNAVAREEADKAKKETEKLREEVSKLRSQLGQQSRSNR